MNKAFRQGQILNLISTREIHTQEDLARALSERGIPATQVTLSRDIKELRLAKTPDGYRQIQPQATGPTLETLAAEFLLDARQVQNLLVLKTAPGHANSLAAALDRENWPEIVGTIAGDDTILVVAPDAATAENVRERIIGKQ